MRRHRHAAAQLERPSEFRDDYVRHCRLAASIAEAVQPSSPNLLKCNTDTYSFRRYDLPVRLVRVLPTHALELLLSPHWHTVWLLIKNQS